MAKVILILTAPIPFSKIGSWTTMYNYYIQNTRHQFDFIVCPQPDKLFEGINYSIVKEVTLFSKLKSKLKVEHRLQNYFNALDKIVQPNQKYVIQIVDNSGIVVPLNRHIISKYNRENFYIQYYYQGFSPLIANPAENKFFNGVDEMIFLTKQSYKTYFNYYNDFVCKASILNNATDSSQFFKLDNDKKEKQKQSMGLRSKLVFIWCSQDRPKKGLDFILQVWKIIVARYGSEIELLIIGASREKIYPGVQFIGRVPNNELAKYYQVSDFYLFPTLWKEGFGIVLAEALKCGCYCIAASQGGVPEVLQFGKLGRLVENPNFMQEWVAAIEEGIAVYKQNNYMNPYSDFVDEDLYDMKSWSKEMNVLIEDAKKTLQ